MTGFSRDVEVDEDFGQDLHGSLVHDGLGSIQYLRPHGNRLSTNEESSHNELNKTDATVCLNFIDLVNKDFQLRLASFWV